MTSDPKSNPNRAQLQDGPTYTEAEDRRVIAGLGLRLTCLWTGERWTHLFERDDPETPANAEPLGEAAESDPARPNRLRVTSPTYQELHEHPMPGGVRILLTGQETPHIFSAVVTAQIHNGDLVIEFDVADRCREAVEILGAMYLVRLDSSALVDASPGRIAWEGGPLGQGRLEFEVVDPESGSVSLAEAGRRASRVQALARIRPNDHTQRLHYRWRWSPSTSSPSH